MAENRHVATRYPIALGVTIGLFAMWGLAHRIHSMTSPQFRAYFDFDYVQAALTFSSVGFSYCLLALPSALFLRRFGYKLGLVFGLVAFSVGALLFYPAVARHEDLFYLAAVVIIGAGWAFLETSANPLILEMGRQETAVRRLNLAQTFYPIGLVIAAYLGRNITVPVRQIVDVNTIEMLVRPYVIVGLCVLLLAFLVEHLEFPPLASERSPARTSISAEIKELWAAPRFRFGLATLAVYMFGLVCLWSVTGVYARQVVPGISKEAVTEISLSTWILCAIGRAAGTALMGRFDPSRLLLAFAIAAAALTVIAALMLSQIGLLFLLSASFFISIMFATIFGTAVQGLGSRIKIASGLLVTAAGGSVTVGTLLISLIARHAFLPAALVPAGMCFLLVALYARALGRPRTSAEPEPA